MSMWTTHAARRDVLSILGLALLAIAALLAGRWWLHRWDSLGRRISFPAISVILLVALSAAACTPGILRARTERRLSTSASALVGTRVTVHCQSLGGALADVGPELGYVKYGMDGVPEHQTLIKRDQCAALSRYLRSNKRHPSWDEVQAVHILTHESMHMAGITNEAAAECAAVQRDMPLDELLGATPTEARALAESYWISQYPRLPDAYRSTECHPGGPLDENRAGAPWTP
jgi:hypothetical protein